MAYCTLTDIEKQLPPEDVIGLTDDDGNGVADEGIVEQAIADADALIDAYCSGRYSVPFSTVPAMIRACSVDIAIFHLYARRRGVTEKREKRKEEAIRFLKDVSAGKAGLGADAPEASTDAGPEASRSESERIFTRDTLENY